MRRTDGQEAVVLIERYVINARHVCDQSAVVAIFDNDKTIVAWTRQLGSVP